VEAELLFGLRQAARWKQPISSERKTLVRKHRKRGAGRSAGLLYIVMSWKLQITQAKPNPVGKDKNKWTPKPDHLLGEWADFKNVGDAAVRLSLIHVAHLEFSTNCVAKEKPVIYWSGSAGTTVQPGEIVRLHTGRSKDASQMATVDRGGVNYHVYAESGSFVLNNDCGDTVSLWWKGNDGNFNHEDVASYDANPPDGAILYRSGSKLVVSALAGLYGT
jgi:hypothetical protein